MKPTLYFLRSSEQKIATDMLSYAYRLYDLNLSLNDIPHLSVYEQFYGFTSKDLGLYALVDNKLAGAAWIRRIQDDSGANAFINENTPVLTIAVLPEFRQRGIGTALLDQLILEAGALYDGISVSVLKDSPAVHFFERVGFVRADVSIKYSPVDASPVITMIKTIDRQEVIRPSDGYDPRRWMD